MNYHEEKMNLLSVPQGYAIAHCISADFALGAGVAKQIEEVFGMRDMLRRRFDYMDFQADGPYCAPCLNVYNLVTKEKYWHRPTLDTLREALLDMKVTANEDGVKKIAMPRIGCGLDRLSWEDVKPMIQEIFADTDIEILVCSL